jgi:glycosyltransferase involved in cell wall biosynthesis
MGPMAGGVEPTRSPARASAAPRARVVAHLIASNFAGGPEKQIVELSARLRDRDWTSIVGSFRENRPAVDVIEQARARGLRTFLIDTRSSFSPFAVGQLVRHLKDFGVEILVTHGYKPTLVGYLARRRAGVVQLPMVRGYTAETRRVRAYEALDRWLLRRFERVLCVSAATREMLVRRGLKRSRLEVLHNGVDAGGDVAASDLCAEFGLPTGSPVLVAAGRLSAEKGHRYLVEAIRLLGASHPTVCLVILGAGREAAELSRQIDAAGLTQRVVLAGFRGDIARHLAAADIVVNPSLTEGLPNVVLEALAVGAPVLATDVGGVGELIIPGRTGWLAPAGDARALADGIAAILADRARARDVGRAGRRWVSDSFSFERQATRFADLCAGLPIQIGRSS